MRSSVRALTFVGTFSLLLGVFGVGCGEATPVPTGQGGSGAGGKGTGGLSGQGGGGGSAACTDGETGPCYEGPIETNGVGPCKPGTATCRDGQWGECVGQVLPGTETCNNIDDDCSGQVDDGFPSQTCGQGACRVVVDGCRNGMVPMCEPGAPKIETCDGTDENCDGFIDNGLDCPCTVTGETRDCYSGGVGTAGVGECKSGTQTCVEMAWSECAGEIVPAVETCDAKDNDCDGQTDEDIPNTTCGEGACFAMVPGCSNGAPPNCVPGQPSPETCNGIDDDCNAVVDDGLGTISCGVGACLVTVQACAGGQTQTCTSGQPMPEVCDGIDNDCNGSADENNPGGGGACTTNQPGVCAPGVLICTSGELVCNSLVMPSNESCDNRDNNCNGNVDEGNPGGYMPCNTGLLGVCATGTTNCTNGGILCSQTTQPSPEVCDGLDNNCNGTNDEGNPGSGGTCTVAGKLGPCAQGVVNCVSGAAKCTQVTFPAAEVCNGIDDNCNGSADEGNPGSGGSCNTGLPGSCGPGTYQCLGGALQCVASMSSSNEQCDGMDNDCNGTIDDGNPGGGQTCNTMQMGVCSVGTTACSSGMIVCNRNTAPSTEVCDGLDNNCNGSVDEGNPGGGVSCNTGMPGACASGTTQCMGGVLQCAPPTTSTNEICDGLDNNCNGVIDEQTGGMACSVPGQVGVCANGTTVCQNGTIMCPQTVFPQNEVCNSLDDNCNGQVDEGNPGGGGSCQVPFQLGACVNGTRACQNGTLRCLQTVFPQDEVCNNIDDDCDAQVDEGNPGGWVPCSVPGQVGPCANGTTFCQNGTLMCPQTVFPQMEACNDVDDNCNGQVDEGNPQGGASCPVAGQIGACANGTVTCTSGSLSCSQTTQSTNEMCGDSVDNDCDGTTDEAPHSVCFTGAPMSTTCSATPCVNSICTYGGGAWSHCCNNTWDASCTLMADAVCGAGTCCAHNVCTLTTPLQNGCSSCVSAICAEKPQCCTTGWTEVCRDRAPMYCNGTSCNVNGQPCAHSVCQTGSNLNSACNACVASICATMPSCCATGPSSWSQACVNAVATKCSAEWACP